MKGLKRVSLFRENDGVLVELDKPVEWKRTAFGVTKTEKAKFLIILERKENGKYETFLIPALEDGSVDCFEPIAQSKGQVQVPLLDIEFLPDAKLFKAFKGGQEVR